jgi:hypothetical protein
MTLSRQRLAVNDFLKPKGGKRVPSSAMKTRGLGAAGRLLATSELWGK